MSETHATSPSTQNDETAIESLARAMFAAFGSADVAAGSLDRLPSLFAPEATITVLAAGRVVTQSVPDFVRPRRELLLGGTLTDFFEWETDGATLLGADVSCRRSRYAKRGKLAEKEFTGGGTKIFTFVRVNGAWKIHSLLWQHDAADA